jgi:UDP-N-acetylglucosamine transferase subunit ALG13
MIFVTVGTQLHFDRLVKTVDEWAGLRGESGVFAQIGPSGYRPKHIQTKQFVDPTEFRARVEAATVMVAHAGMGSILTALEFGKPIVVMPRRADLGEQRNDHQLATAKRFAEQGRIIVAFNEHELIEKLDSHDSFRQSEGGNASASPNLVAAIRGFIEKGHTRGGNQNGSTPV